MPFKEIPELYSVWQGMKARCLNPRSKAYPDYGGRGIKVCDRWLNDYAAFAADMGERPPGTSIERIDNNGHYEPGNCRWATRKEQQRNQRRAVYVTIEGVRYRAIELAEQAGVKVDTVVKRAARGLPLADVLSTDRLRPDYSTFIPQIVATRVAKQRGRTHCKDGHEFTEANSRYTKEGWRVCRACHNAKMRRLNAAKRG